MTVHITVTRMNIRVTKTIFLHALLSGGGPPLRLNLLKHVPKHSIVSFFVKTQQFQGLRIMGPFRGFTLGSLDISRHPTIRWASIQKFVDPPGILNSWICQNIPLIVYRYNVRQVPVLPTTQKLFMFQNIMFRFKIYIL